MKNVFPGGPAQREAPMQHNKDREPTRTGREKAAFSETPFVTGVA